MLLLPKYFVKCFTRHYGFLRKSYGVLWYSHTHSVTVVNYRLS